MWAASPSWIWEECSWSESALCLCCKDNFLSHHNTTLWSDNVSLRATVCLPLSFQPHFPQFPVERTESVPHVSAERCNYGIINLTHTWASSDISQGQEIVFPLAVTGLDVFVLLFAGALLGNELSVICKDHSVGRCQVSGQETAAVRNSSFQVWGRKKNVKPQLGISEISLVWNSVTAGVEGIGTNSFTLWRRGMGSLMEVQHPICPNLLPPVAQGILQIHSPH